MPEIDSIRVTFGSREKLLELFRRGRNRSIVGCQWELGKYPCCRNCHFLTRRISGRNVSQVRPSGWTIAERQSLCIDYQSRPLSHVFVGCQRGYREEETVDVRESLEMTEILSALVRKRKGCQFVRHRPGETFDAAYNRWLSKENTSRFRETRLIAWIGVAIAFLSMLVAVFD